MVSMRRLYEIALAPHASTSMASAVRISGLLAERGKR
jgi:hypothetical protein